MNSYQHQRSSGLQRSRQYRLIGGVVSGIWESYRLPINLTLLRVLVVVFSVITVFPGLLAYLLLWVLVPERQD